MNPAIKRHHKTLTATGITTIFFVGYVTYLLRLQPDVAFMDSLRFLRYVDESLSGESSILTTWNQGSHRGLLPQVFVYLNVKYFNYHIFGSTILSGLVIAATAIIINKEQIKTVTEASFTPALAAIITTNIALFSLANWELYSLDVGATLFLKNLSFILYWVFLEKIIRAHHSSAIAQVCLLLAGPFIILFIAYGWSYAFGAASILWLLFWAKPDSQASKALRTKTIISLLAGLILYIAIGAVTSTDNTPPSFQNSQESLFNAITGFLYLLSSSLLGSESINFYEISSYSKIAAAVFIILMCAFFIKICYKNRDHISILPITLIIYPLINTAAISLARGKYDPALAMAPRYFIDISLIIIGISWGAVLILNNKNPLTPARKTYIALAGALMAVFIAGQSVTASDEWEKAPYRKNSFEAMKEITLRGVTTKNEATLLQSPLLDAQRGVETQRKYKIGPFSQDQ